jgi:hypothetical protein
MCFQQGHKKNLQNAKVSEASNQGRTDNNNNNNNNHKSTISDVMWRIIQECEVHELANLKGISPCR